MRRAFGDTGIDGAITEFTAGWFNVTYGIRLGDGRNVVLKIAPPPGVPVLGYEANIMSTEVATMRLLRNHPVIPVPTIHFYDPSREICDADYFFMERVPGTPLDAIKQQLDAVQLASIETQTGKILRAINGFRGAYFGYPGNPELQGVTWPETFSSLFESLLQDAEAVGVKLAPCSDDLRLIVSRNLDALTEVNAPCLVHWDLWETNIVIDGGSVAGIIDFERALWAEPLMEAQFRALSDEGVTDVMRSYGKKQFTRSEYRRCDLYSLYLGLIMLVESVYRAYDTEDVTKMGSELIAGAVQRLSLEE